MASDSSPGRFPKKYLGSVNKSNQTGSQRSGSAKSLTTGSKVSAPKPLNLPSLRRESSKVSPDSSGSTSGESDHHHPTSITHTPATINRWGSPLQQQQTTSDTDTKSKDSTSSSSPVAQHSSPSASPAWGISSTTTNKATDITETSVTTSTSTTYGSPPCDSTPKNTILSPKKEHVKVTVSHHAKTAEIPMPFTQASEPSNMSWDEMVSEEMDFNVSVVEDDNDNGVKLEDRGSALTSLEDTDDNASSSENQSLQHQPVSPSDRFTDDYDRSYPSTSKRTTPGSLYNSQPQDIYRHQDRYHHHHQHHHYHDMYYNNNMTATQSGGKWSSERRGSEHSNTSGYRGQRRSSNSSHTLVGTGWGIHNEQQRRVSQDRTKLAPLAQPSPSSDTSSTTTTSTTTLLRRPSTSTNSNNTNGLYSTSDDRPPEIVAAQRQAMLSAAEQAKKRREADEAERQAAAARARQKALALAPPPQPSSAKSIETTPPPSSGNQTSRTTSTTAITILSHADETHGIAMGTLKDQKMTTTTTTTTTAPIVKSGTIITSTTASTGTHHLFANKPRAPLTEDEKLWEEYVNQVKNPATTTVNTSEKGGEGNSSSVSAWSSFAQRLQQSTENTKAKRIVHSTTNGDSLVDQQQQFEPEAKKEKLDNITSSTSSSDQQQDKSESKITTDTIITQTSTTSAPSVSADGETTNTVESRPNKPRRFSKPNAILDKAVYPIFPDAIGRFVHPKPTSLQFMIDPDESDAELLYTLERHYGHQADSPSRQTQDIPPSFSTDTESTAEQTESLSLLNDQAPALHQHTDFNTKSKRQPTATVNNQLPPDSQQITPEKEEESPISYDDALYPDGLPVPDNAFGSIISPASITPASIRTTLSNFDILSGYANDILPVPHCKHYPLLMYPLHSPPTDFITMDSDQENQHELSVVLLPPGNVSLHHRGPRRGHGRHRGPGGRSDKHRHHHPSSGNGSWRPVVASPTSTKTDRPTAKTA